MPDYSINEKKPVLLVIDDDKSIQRGLKRYFSNIYNVITVDNGAKGIEFLSENTVHCILLDIKMKGMNGFDTYPQLKSIASKVPIIFYSGFQDEHDLKAILNQYNPAGYFAKGDDIEKLKITIKTSIQKCLVQLNQKSAVKELENKLVREKKNKDELHQRLLSQYKFDTLIGCSPKMVSFKQLCEKAIHSDITVFIQGETGTGKELIANIIHANSSRANKPFLIQNCAGIPDNLFESELFGHKKGAYTGAIVDKKGIFELADKGTVFLDEVGDLPITMQAKLLRLLQEGEVRSVGGTSTKTVDVRIISATNRDLADDVKHGRFREDLYYRLNVFKLSPPPLRKIREDLPLLTNFFIQKFKKKHSTTANTINKDAFKILSSYSFPGNVRELENEIERAIVVVGMEGKYIEPGHLSENLLDSYRASKKNLHGETSLKKMVERFEQNLIVEALKKHKGNKTHASKELGLSRVGLNNKIQRYKIA